MCFYPLGSEEGMIGRSASCLIQITDDDQVSRQHAALERAGGRWTITDQGSSNGLFLAGRRIRSAVLMGGEVFRIGATFFLYIEQGEGFVSVLRRFPIRQSSMVGGPRIELLRRLLTRFAHNDLTVLIKGETGTGKEVAAQLIHQTSSRRSGSFIPINCSAIPEQIFESQLMGHVKGAFTDARSSSVGLIRRAHGGTLFLDEIGELPLSLQPKLLRVIQERRVLSVGGVESTPVDVRIICATNADLEQRIDAGTFREDLYARINGLELTLPPLRQRKEDIPLLAHHFLERVADSDYGLTTAAVELLCAQRWPRNVRQLENRIQRAVIMADREKQLKPEHFAGFSIPKEPVAGTEMSPKSTFDDPKAQKLHQALLQNKGNAKESARMLGISRSQLYRWVRRFEIDLEAYRS
jgi:transcriptional regulator with PAS, ATPase and Fis domain